LTLTLLFTNLPWLAADAASNPNNAQS